MDHAKNVRDAFGFLTPGELALLQRFAGQLPEDSVIVNIGAGAGTSGLAFVEACPHAIVYTVDAQDASFPTGSLEGERNAFRDAGLLHLLNHSWYQIHGDSKEVGRGWLAAGRPRIDLLFIDGDHEYSGAAGDILAWLPSVVHTGIIAIHDYDKAKNDPTDFGRRHPFPGVDKAVREILIQSATPVVAQVDCLIAFRKESYE